WSTIRSGGSPSGASGPRRPPSSRSEPGVRELADLLSRFVLPLVRGGELVVGRPISMEELGALEAQIPHATREVVEVDDARADVIADLVVSPPALVFEADELSLAAALHNLLFLVHPRADTWAVSSSARRRVLETAQE